MTTYAESGVDVDKNDTLVNRIKKITNISTGFADARRIPANFDQIVQCTDGVGTKIKLAHAWSKLHIIGQDLVAMCVNDLICAGAKPMFFQDYIGMNSLDAFDVDVIVNSIHTACVSCGVTLTGGEMAELPDTYTRNIPELVGFATGFTNDELKMSKDRVEKGDVIVALPSSGPHSNGYSLINKIVKDKGETVDPSEMIQACLVPTKIYHEVVDIHLLYPWLIKSAAHITGGGLISNLNRAIQKHQKIEIDYLSWHVPKVFNQIQTSGEVPIKDMWKTFNMGVGMCLIVSYRQENVLMNELAARGVNPFIIGTVV